MPFFISKPGSLWLFFISRSNSRQVFKATGRLMSDTPIAVFEAHVSPVNNDYLEIADWLRYRPPRPTVHHLDVIEVQGPARAISLAERDELVKRKKRPNKHKRSQV